jgi:hypothetical protein
VSWLESSQVSTALLDDAADYGSLQDQVGRSHVRRVGDECQDRGGQRVRRVGHYPERMSWSDEFLQIALDD